MIGLLHRLVDRLAPLSLSGECAVEADHGFHQYILTALRAGALATHPDRAADQSEPRPRGGWREGDG